MKSTKYIVLGLIAGIYSSCTNLDENPKSFLSPQNYYKTEGDAVSAVSSVYFLLNSGGTLVQTPYNTLFATGMDFMSDDVDPGPGATNPDVRSQAVLQHSSSGLRVLQIWQQHYSGIAKANVAIDKIADISFSDASKKARLIGEAKLLRALFYFNLVRLYGDVPLILHNSTDLDLTGIQVSRTPADSVYKQIQQDLIDATSVLPVSYSGADVGRATKGAAQSLLSKVYLTRGQWQDASQTAYGVITGGYGYNLVTSFPDLFNPGKKAAARIEHIFDAEFASNSLGQGNNQAPRGAKRGVPGIPSGAYADQLRFYTNGTDKFFSVYKLYKKNDKRLAVDAQGYGAYRRFFVGSDGKKYWDANVAAKTVGGIAIPADTVPYLNKYWDATQAANLSQSAANVPIIRYAEVLLIHAEAENEANGGPTSAAYNSINAVRTRAGLPNLTPGLGQNAFRDSVYLDRRLELVWENQRWFDLIRQKDSNGQNGTYLIEALNKVGKTSVQAKHYLYPIPQQEIQLNPKLTQNPGW